MHESPYKVRMHHVGQGGGGQLSRIVCTLSLFRGSRTLQVPGVISPHWLLVFVPLVSSVVSLPTIREQRDLGICVSS